MASTDELWLIDFGDPYPGEPAAHRPALVIGPVEPFSAGLPYVIVVPLTTTRRGLDLHVEIDAEPATGLETTSYAQCELLRSVSGRRLLHRLGRVDLATHFAVDDILRALLGH